MEFKLDFGDVVEDTISGFRGVVTAKVVYPPCTIKYQVVSNELGEGKVWNDWFPETRLVKVSGVNRVPV